MVSYEIWDTRSGNVLAEFDSEDEAIAFARSVADDHARAAAAALELLMVDEHGKPHAVDRGDSLADRVLGEQSRPQTPSPSRA